MPRKPMSRRLTPAERDLLDSMAAGTLVDLSGRPEDEKVIDAELIRDILVSRRDRPIDPRGVRIVEAIIRGLLDLENVTTDVGLQLYGCEFSAPIYLVDATLPYLYLNSSRITTRDEPGIDADRVRLQTMDLNDTEISTDGTDEHDSVSLMGARIEGNLDCSGAVVKNTSGGCAVNADDLHVNGNAYFRDGFRASSASKRATIRLPSAHIGRTLDCTKAEIKNTVESAIRADNLYAGRDILLRHGFQAAGVGEHGAINLLDIHIGGAIECDGATIENTTGPAIRADGLRTGSYAAFRDGFRATGAGERGTIDLLHANIGGNLDFTGADVRCDDGGAISAHNVEINGNVFLHSHSGGRFRASGASVYGVVALRRATITGSLEISGASLTNTHDPVTFSDENLDLDQDLGASLDLAGTRVGDVVILDDIEADNPHGAALLRVDGLTYSGVPVTGPDEPTWLDRIRYDTGSYSAQPYQQLAAAYRAEGHDAEQRAVLMAQRHDQITRGTLPWRDRQWVRFTGLTLGYGFQPWRALVALLAVAMLAVGLAIGMGHGSSSALEATAGGPCAVVDRIGVGLDLSVPLVSTGSQERCQVSDEAAGQRFVLIAWLLQVLGWAFATLFVAGFTRAVRKT